MIDEYINAAMESAHYEIIKDEEPFYGEISELPGVWASGLTLEECRNNLKENLEGWILIRNSLGLEIPPIKDFRLTTPRLMKVA